MQVRRVKGIIESRLVEGFPGEGNLSPSTFSSVNNSNLALELL